MKITAFRHLEQESQLLRRRFANRLEVKRGPFFRSVCLRGGGLCLSPRGEAEDEDQ